MGQGLWQEEVLWDLGLFGEIAGVGICFYGDRIAGDWLGLSGGWGGTGCGTMAGGYLGQVWGIFGGLRQEGW